MPKKVKVRRDLAVRGLPDRDLRNWPRTAKIRWAKDRAAVLHWSQRTKSIITDMCRLESPLDSYTVFRGQLKETNATEAAVNQWVESIQ